MKTITVEIDDDEILVAIKRQEEYEDVDPELVVEDMARWHASAEWRLVEPKENT
jgi:hypothetical protein